MVKPTNLLRSLEAASGPTRRIARRQENNVRQPAASMRMQTVGRLPLENRPSNLLIRNVPKTVLPTDLLRALKESGAVESEFPITNITSPPPSYPRKASLTKTYHLTTPSPARAQDIHRLLSARPLFAYSSSVIPSPYYPRPGQGSSSNPNSNLAGTGSGARPNPGIRETARVIYTEYDRRRWVDSLIRQDSEGSNDVRLSSTSRPPSHEEEEKDELTLGRDYAGGDRRFSGLNRGTRRDNHDRGDVSLRKHVPLPTSEWAMDPGCKGRRVVVKGLPGMIPDEDVRKLAKDCDLQHGDDACKRLPPMPNALVSTYVITTNSVAMAYKLARKLNMNYYLSTVYGERYMMRTEVAW